MEKNQAGKWVVFAFQDEGGANPGEPKTGDAANITANLRIDGGAANAVDDVNPTELEDGYYIFDITATESNGDLLLIAPASATANINVIGIPGTVYTRPPNFNLLGIEADGHGHADMKEISGAATAADNLELQYDTTGLTGDTFPATQAQINQVANVSGQAKRAASAYVLTTGTQSANTISAVEELDGTRHEHTDTAGAMDLYYEFEIGAGLATEVKFTGYLQGNNDDLEVHGYDWVSAGWKQIGTLNGQASSNNAVNEYDLLVDMVGSGVDEGKVRVRFTDGAFTLTTATLAIDQLLVVFSLGDGAYENGAIWLDTNASNTNTVRGVDGRASNPVSTIGAVNTLLASANLNRVEVAPNSSFTLAATQANQQFRGKNWTLALGGQSISGSYIEGADISGIGTGANEIHFDRCHFGNVTLPPCDSENCILEGTFTFGTAGNFLFENVSSGVAGTSTPVIDFGSSLNASNLNLRGASLGIELRNMGAGTGSYNCSLEGFGQLVIDATCSATSTIAIRGHFPVSGDATAIAAITFSDDARFHHKSEIDRLGYGHGAVWIDTVSGAAGTVVGVNGIESNPVSTLADAVIIAAAIGVTKYRLLGTSSILLISAHTNWSFHGSDGATVTLGGVNTNGAHFECLKLIGDADGNDITARFCELQSLTNLTGTFEFCRLVDDATLVAGDTHFFQCASAVAGTGTPYIDLNGNGVNARNLHLRGWLGGIEIRTHTSVDTTSFDCPAGQIVVHVSCTGGTIAMRGNINITDNASGAVTFSQNAAVNMSKINTEVLDVVNTDALVAGVSITESLRRTGAITSGEISGAGTGTETFEDYAGSASTIVIIVDASGNRSSITYN